MEAYSGQSDFRHDEIPAVGVLLTNVGTPDGPTAPALRRYLKQFLWDQRVVEPPPPRWLWWLILNGIILNTRPAKSAKLYRNIWTPEGSPLLLIARRQGGALEKALRERFGGPVHVAIGMGYGQPSIQRGLEELRAKLCRRILVLPAFPQYSGPTTGSTFDGVANALKTWRWIPELRFNTHYHDHPGYIGSLAASVSEHWRVHGTPAKLVISFHGIPRRYFLAGDPYHCHCMKTARLLVQALGIGPEKYVVTFQSRFGKEPWLEPYTDETLVALAKSGVGRVDTLCPAFSADCLETLEEMAMTNREVFEHAGGKEYGYIPALNDRPDHIAALTDVAAGQMEGWLTPLREWQQGQARDKAAATDARHAALRAISPNAKIPAGGE